MVSVVLPVITACLSNYLVFSSMLCTQILMILLSLIYSPVGPHIWQIWDPCVLMNLHISAYKAGTFYSSVIKTEHQWGWLPSLHRGYQSDSDLVKLNTNHPGVKRKEMGLFSEVWDIFTKTPTTRPGTRRVVDQLPGAAEPNLGVADQACVPTRRRWTSW